MSAHEFIGHYQISGSECDGLPAPQLRALGMTDADIEHCTLRDWQQVETLMRAFAATRPKALGTIRLLRHRR